MTLSLRVLLPVADLAPGEALAPIAVIANTGEEPATVPDMEGPGGYQPRFELRAAGRPPEAFSLSPGARPGEGKTIELEPGRERGRGVNLERLGADAPGVYELSFSLEQGGARVTSSPGAWRRHAAERHEGSIPVGRGTNQLLDLPCFHLFHGGGVHALLETRVTTRQEEEEVVVSSAATRCLDVADDARGLVTAAAPEPFPALRARWAAWLEGDRVRAGTPFMGFNHRACPLPFAPGRILPRPTLRADGGLDVFVLAADGLQLALVSFFPPTERPPQPIVVDDDDAPAEEDDAPVDPMALVDMPAPEVRWTLALDEAPRAGAAARAVGPWSARVGLVLAFEREDGLELRYAPFDPEVAPRGFGVQRVHGARLLPDAGPALHVDRDGCGQVALLVQAAPAPGDPKKRLRLAHVQLSFDPDARPLVTEATRYDDLGPLPGRPRTAGIDVFVDPDGPPRTDWLLVTEDEAAWVGHGGDRPRKLARALRPLLPLALTTIGAGLFVLGRDEHGAVRALRCAD
ncbi:MAG: hypothetical protein M9894_22235 [Planctomycetes bacterium]|nr:hypothetical protein [Planctomycetota bacterium]